MNISHIEINTSVCFKFKFNAAFIQWSTGINFLKIGWFNWFQNRNFVRNLQARICNVSITEITVICWSGIHFSLVKISLLVRRRRLIFGERFQIIRRFVGFPPPSCLRKVFFPTSVAADLNYFVPAITFPISRAANSIKSAPTLFAAGTTYGLKNGIAVLPIVCDKAPNPLPLCLE